MQRKQLERYYDVRIYQESGGYVVVLPEGAKKFRYMFDLENYLEKREENIRKYGSVYEITRKD